MGLASEQPVKVDDTAFIATSFPGFVADDARPGRGFRLTLTGLAGARAASDWRSD